MNGLKQTLIKYLQRNKRLDLNQLFSLCGREHKKSSNAERRFREMMQPDHPSFNPNIKAEKNAKGAIVAYVWNGLTELKTIEPKHLTQDFTTGQVYRPPQTEAAKLFLQRNSNEWNREVKELNTLF